MSTGVHVRGRHIRRSAEMVLLFIYYLFFGYDRYYTARGQQFAGVYFRREKYRTCLSGLGVHYILPALGIIKPLRYMPVDCRQSIDKNNFRINRLDIRRIAQANLGDLSISMYIINYYEVFIDPFCLLFRKNANRPQIK